jgi:hypothetical protein
MYLMKFKRAVDMQGLSDTSLMPATDVFNEILFNYINGV